MFIGDSIKEIHENAKIDYGPRDIIDDIYNCYGTIVKLHESMESTKLGL